jgi:methionine-rich copper-binding protein CopC
MKYSQIIISLALLTAVPLFVGSAVAHPKLQVSVPPQGGSVDVSPTELQLSFNEDALAKLSRIDLKDSGGKAVAIGAVASGASKKQLVVPLPAKLPVGNYTVNWGVVSEDTHRVEGRYSFKVNR